MALPLIYEVAPRRKDRTDPQPLLLLLHGRGSDEHDLLSLVPSSVPDFLVVSVRAPYQFPYGGFTWFDLEDLENPDLDQLTESRRLLASFLSAIQNVERIDPNNIFLFGFSMGAMMALEVALRELVKIKGIVAHSGGILRSEQLPFPVQQLRNLSIFFAHGTYDPVIPVELARQSYEILRQANFRIQYQEYSIEHTVSEESLRDVSRWLRDQLIANESKS